MSDDQSARLGLPYLAAGQMQKHVTLNEALTRLDALVQSAVVSRSEAEQPAEPADGDLYILPADAEGEDWASHGEGVLMRAEARAWSPVAVADGAVALVLDEGVVLVRLGGEWIGLGQTLDDIQSLGRLGLNTTADDANPLAVRLNAVLFTALETGAGGDGDLRLKLNKQTAANVLSVLMQTAYGGRAELGLIGDDQFRLKVSPDGATWHEVFSAASSNGRATFALGTTRAELTVMTVTGTYAVPPWARTLSAVCVGGGGGGGAGHYATAGTARYGGGGGGAGGLGEARWLTEDLPSSLSVTVGAGGAGGAAAAGGGGLPSQVTWSGTVLANGVGGFGGALGTASSGAAGAGGYGAPTSNAGGQSNLGANGQAGRTYDRADAPGGGGGGGAVDAANTARAGGPGGNGGSSRVRALGGSGGSGDAGAVGVTAPLPDLHWAGGGGGGGSGAVSGAGFSGAAGGLHGGGGGGGGAGVTAGGSGGAGAAGVVWLLAEG